MLIIRRFGTKPSIRTLTLFSSTTNRRTFATETGLIPTDPVELYRAKVALGQVKYDPEQVRALYELRKLTEALIDYSPPVALLTLLESLRPNDPNSTTVVKPTPDWPFKRSPLSSLGMNLLPSEILERDSILSMSEKVRSKELVKVLKGEQGLESLTTPKGFLLIGPPGTGKSLLMDIFFESLPISHKVRFHYHHFLLSIYSKVHDALEIQRLQNEAEEKAMNEAGGEEGYHWSRRDEMKALAITKGWRAVFAGGRSANDPDLNTKEFVLATIARELIKEHGFLLAFDEVQLVDIAGAGLINRVLSWYWRLGGVVVGTSNRVPADLYNAGVQRDSIDDFLTALSARSPVVELRSATDYRREQRSIENTTAESDLPPGDFGLVSAWNRWGSGARGWYIKGEEKEFNDAVLRLTGGLDGTRTDLLVYGRKLEVPWHLDGVARFTFHDLCEKALGPADFISLGSRFHTIIVDDVPVLLLNAKNEARRLITMLDSFYETKTRLLVSAEVGIDELFFPDAVKGARLPAKEYSVDDFNGQADDVVTHNGSDHPFSSERIYESDLIPSMPGNSALRAHSPVLPVDPMGEEGDSLTGEFGGDTILDLVQPYRPSASSNVKQLIPIDERNASQPIKFRGTAQLRAGSVQAKGVGMDASAEIGDSLIPETTTDSLTEEMMGDLIADLEAPYRPNVSSYGGESDKFYNKAPKVEKKRAKRVTEDSTGTYGKPHPSASPSFASLAIFTGEEERFAYKRAVSRVHEMSSGEFLRTAKWSPLSPSLRTWERPVKHVLPILSTPTPSKSFMGDKVDLSSAKLSGVLSPADLRLRFPEGIPIMGTEVEVNREEKLEKGKKYTLEELNPTIPSPVLKSDHVWGVREDWGKKSGDWGKGAKAYEVDSAAEVKKDS